MIKLAILISFLLGTTLVMAAPSCVFYEFDQLGSYKGQHDEFFRAQMKISLKKLQLQLMYNVVDAGNMNRQLGDRYNRLRDQFEVDQRKHEAYQTRLDASQVGGVLRAREYFSQQEPDLKMHQTSIVGLSPLIKKQNQSINMPEITHFTNADIKAISYAMALPELQIPVLELLESADSSDPNKVYNAINELEIALVVLDRPLDDKYLCDVNESGDLAVNHCKQEGVLPDEYLKVNEDIITNLIPVLQKNNQLAEVNDEVNADTVHAFFRYFGPFSEFKCDQKPNMQELIGDCKRQEESYNANKRSYEEGDFLKEYQQGVESLEKIVPIFKQRCDEWMRDGKNKKETSPYINIVSRCETYTAHSNTVLDMECVHLNNGIEKVFSNYRESFVRNVQACRLSSGKFVGGGSVINE